MPVTVKTRLGWDHDSIHIVEVAERLQDVERKRFPFMGAPEHRCRKGSQLASDRTGEKQLWLYIPVFGNGDVDSPEKAVLMRDEFGLDGAMIGRASIGNPWFFAQVKHYFKTGQHLSPPNLKDRNDGETPPANVH